MTTNQNAKPNLGIHFFYVTFILVAIIILLATTKWTELAKFTDYLSTAATITSLVLGLLAIIYAYISNDSLSQTTGVLSESASQAQESTVKIASLLATVDSVAAGSSRTNERLAGILDDLKSQMRSLDETVSTLDSQASAITAVLPEIPKGLDAIGKRLEEFVQAPPKHDNKSVTPPISEESLNALANLCVTQASPAGLLLMYACHLSYSSKIEFNVKSFSKDFSTGDYMYGFFIAIWSIDLIEFTRGKPASMVTVTQCPPEFENAREKFVEKIDNLKSDESKNSWREILTDVENHFLEVPF